jgi:transcriptional regulator with XRE-family HTH domain
MPAIHENLKSLRIANGLSQLEVADTINVARQTVSSYETGRTQPDLETLKRLAELYKADLHDVLYGGNRLQRRVKLFRRIACIISAVLLLSLLVHSVLFLVNNTFFVLNNRTEIADEGRQIIDVHFDLLNAAENAVKIGRGIFYTGCLGLLCLLITMEKPPSVKTRMAWLVCLELAAFAVVFPFMLIDKVYGYADYLYPVWSMLPNAALLFLASVAVDVVRRIRKKTA